METNNKNSGSLILMVIGFIFIIIAGGIFVTTAWQYLPDMAKKMSLLVLSMVMFVVSYMVSKKTELYKTETVLYYLGVVFAGFFVLSIMGGLMTYPAENMAGEMDAEDIVRANAFRIFMANLIMTIPVGIRVAVRKKGIDFLALMVLLDSMVICISIAMQIRIDVVTIICCLIVVALSVLDSFFTKGMQEGLRNAIRMSYVVHGIVAFVMTLAFFMVDDSFIGFATIAVSSLVMVTAITNRNTGSREMRVINSMAVCWLAYVTVSDLSMAMGGEQHSEFVCFAAFVVCVTIAICIKRKEILYILIPCCSFAPFVQIYKTTVNDTVYLPFSFVMAAALVIWYFREQRNVKILKIAGIQAVMGMLAGIVELYQITTESMNLSDCSIGYYALKALALLIIAVIVDDRAGKKILESLALANEIVSLMILVNNLEIIPAEYMVECRSFVAGIGIVLLGKVWYDNKKDIGIIQLIMVCIVMGRLLIYNLFLGEIAHALILAITALIMLLTAVWKNSKAYIITSSTTLILVALYLTRDFWLNISWYVYLFVAGVILIAIAIKREKDNKN